MRALAALLGVLVLAGCATAVPAAPAPSAGPVAVAVTSAPVAVRIPAIGAASTLIRTGLHPDGSLEVPDVRAPEQASWWTGSPQPGALGPATILGHVDGAGRPGVFARLAELAPGDQVLVDREDGTAATFVVDAVEQVPKVEFDDPTSAATARVFGDTASPELRLITCGGDFDRTVGHYEDQVVVYAHLAGP